MQLRDFQLERYYAEHEFTTRYQLSASDCESLSIEEALKGSGTSTKDFLGLRLHGEPGRSGAEGGDRAVLPELWP